MTVDWTALEAVRATVFDVLRTGIFGIGAWFAFVQLREQYKLRRLQTLYSLNERLSKRSKANDWIAIYVLAAFKLIPALAL